MPLPVLNTAGEATFDPVRAYGRAMFEWGRGVAASEASAEYGTLLANPALPTVAEANAVLDAYLTGDATPAAVVADAEARFRSWGTPCRAWTLNPSMSADRIRPLADHLAATGWSPRPRTVLQLGRLRPPPHPPATFASLLPARSAYAAFARLNRARWPDDPDTVGAAESHLDDPRVDAVVAVAGGDAVGSAHLLNAGDVGTVVDLYVAPPHRRRGLGSTLLRSLLDTAARGGHRHVLAGIGEATAGASRVLEQLGFYALGQWARYERAAYQD